MNGGGEVLRSIQHLRALAALSVVLFHILQWEAGGAETLRAGVDLFFVISGVIMWKITAGRPANPASFLWRRATRVAPAYWVATSALFALALAWPAFLPKVKPHTGHLLLSLAFIPHMDPLGLPFPLLAPGWTLSYEALFYLLFAACLLGPQRFRPWMITGALLAVVLVGYFVGDPLWILIANPLLLEFAAGVWLGATLLQRRRPGAAWGAAMALAGFALLGLQLATGWRTEPWRAATWGIPAALVVGGALILERAGSIPRLPTFLGDASYSIYLWHPMAVALIAHLVGWPRPWIFIPAALAATIAAGLAGRAWIEKPLISAARRAR